MARFVVGAGAYMLGVFGDLYDDAWMEDYDHPPDKLYQEDTFVLTEKKIQENFRLSKHRARSLVTLFEDYSEDNELPIQTQLNSVTQVLHVIIIYLI